MKEHGSPTTDAAMTDGGVTSDSSSGRKRKRYHLNLSQKRLKRSSVESHTVSVTRIDTPIYANVPFSPTSPSLNTIEESKPDSSSSNPSDVTKKGEVVEQKDCPESGGDSFKQRSFRVSLSLPEEVETKPLPDKGNTNIVPTDGILPSQKSASADKDTEITETIQRPNSLPVEKDSSLMRYLTSPSPTEEASPSIHQQAKKSPSVEDSSLTGSVHSTNNEKGSQIKQLMHLKSPDSSRLLKSPTISRSKSKDEKVHVPFVASPLPTCSQKQPETTSQAQPVIKSTATEMDVGVTGKSVQTRPPTNAVLINSIRAPRHSDPSSDSSRSLAQTPTPVLVSPLQKNNSITREQATDVEPGQLAKKTVDPLLDTYNAQQRGSPKVKQKMVQSSNSLSSPPSSQQPSKPKTAAPTSVITATPPSLPQITPNHSSQPDQTGVADQKPSPSPPGEVSTTQRSVSPTSINTTSAQELSTNEAQATTQGSMSPQSTGAISIGNSNEPELSNANFPPSTTQPPSSEAGIPISTAQGQDGECTSHPNVTPLGHKAEVSKGAPPKEPAETESQASAEEPDVIITGIEPCSNSTPTPIRDNRSTLGELTSSQTQKITVVSK